MSSAVDTWKERLARIPGLAVLMRTIEKSNEDHPKDMAASIAYFSFFSLFPLLVGVIAGASLFLERADIQARLDKLLSGEFPGSADFLRTNIDALIDLRGAAGIASVVGLLWSGSKMFGALSRGINLALGIAKETPFYLSRLRDFVMTIVGSLLLLCAVIASMAVDVMVRFKPTQLGLDNTTLAALGGHAATFAFEFVLAFILYALVPYKKVPRRELVPGAVVAALLFELGKALFVLYLDYAASLKAVYGSLSSVIVLLLWLYFTARVLLFGAEVIAVRKQA